MNGGRRSVRGWIGWWSENERAVSREQLMAVRQSTAAGMQGEESFFRMANRLLSFTHNTRARTTICVERGVSFKRFAGDDQITLLSLQNACGERRTEICRRSSLRSSRYKEIA